jgi:glucose/mannose transport system permease protein
VAASVETAFVGTARFWRVLIYTTLIVFAIMYLLPLFVDGRDLLQDPR